MPAACFDPQLIRRYDRTGPRYTSYPTAAQFHHHFKPDDYRAAISHRSGARAPLSLYVHIPFCSNPCFYCGCTRLITRSPTAGDQYLQLLEREIALQAALFPRPPPVEQLHLGGGTPTFLSDDQLRQLMALLARYFVLDDSGQREFSIEMDPRSVGKDTVGTLAALGFNRFSLGIQDFDPVVQQAVNRVQGFEQTEAVMTAARHHGARSVSVDLIYGLPWQTPQTFTRTLQQVVDLAPDRISAYSYAHLPQLFRAQSHIREADLPDAETKFALLQCTVEQLQQAGYVHIGMDHFARPDDELSKALEDGSLQRNFQGYSTRGGLDLIGLGLSAISRIGDCYSQNSRTLDHYRAVLQVGELPVARGYRLDTEDQLRRQVIENIMCAGQVDYASLESQYPIDFHRHFADALSALAPLQQDGLVELGPAALRVTPAGRYLLRAVAMPFDAHLRPLPAPAGVPRPAYSKVI